MKIYAFEVRDDEGEYFKEVSQIPGIELELHSEGLTRTNISKLESGCMCATRVMIPMVWQIIRS